MIVKINKENLLINEIVAKDINGNVTTYLIENGYNWDGKTYGNKIGKSLAARTDWCSSDEIGDVGNDIESNNSSGFSGLPTGYRSEAGEFKLIGELCCWWSSTEINSSLASHRALVYFNESKNLKENVYDKRCGYCIRLVKD